MVRWCRAVNASSDHYASLDRQMTEIISAWFDGALAGPKPWTAIGFQRAVLGLKLNFLSGSRERETLAAIKRHINSCFPLDSSAPRLSDPDAANPRLFTPYFAHFTMPELIKRGDMDFVLDTYRKAWGWALQDGRTTWVEVFDPRWSHCHEWSGCPTWQLTRFVLGLDARFDRGPLHYALNLRPGSLPAAKGTIPLPNGRGVIKVRWSRAGTAVRYRLETPVPILLHPEYRQGPGAQRPVTVERELDLLIPGDAF